MLRLSIRQYQPPVIRIENRILLSLQSSHIHILSPINTLRSFKIHLGMHLLQERSSSSREPAPATQLERAQVTAPIRRNKQRIRVLAHLLVRQARFITNRIVFRVDAQERDADSQYRIYGLRVPIIRAFGRVTPSRTLDMSIEFVEVLGC